MAATASQVAVTSSILSLRARGHLANVGSRSSLGGLTVTVFGATGFLGNYVCSLFGNSGNALVIPYRGDELEVRHLKVMCDLGNMAQIPFSPRDYNSVLAAVRHSDLVINLIGKHYETKHLLPWMKNYTYDDTHVTTARTIAEACTETGVPRLIHVSSAIANPASPSIWAGSKWRGEQAVKKAFPKANIIRPTVMFGDNDRFLCLYANTAKLLSRAIIFDGGETKVQPVFVGDVATGIFNIAHDENLNGRTLQFVGDEVYTMKEVVELVYDTIRRPLKFLNLPCSVAAALGAVAQQFPNPMITEDLVRRTLIDQVRDESFPGLENVNVSCTSMEKQCLDYVRRFRLGGHFVDVSGYH